MTDRKELEEALNKPTHADGMASHVWVILSAWNIITRAAREHLETLPKAQWKVRVWANESDICAFSSFPTRIEAETHVRMAFGDGARKVEIEAP